MIRTPQALLLSLFLHLLIGVLLFLVVVPKVGMPTVKPSERCLIALSRVLPAVPVKEVIPIKQRHEEPVHRTIPKQPIQKEKQVERQARKALPVTKPLAQPKPEAHSVQKVEKVKMASFNDHSVAQESRKAFARESAAVKAPEPPMPQPVLQSSESYLNDHLATIARLLQEYLYYPRMARKRHIEGEVLAVFTLERDGSIHAVSIKKHARSILDRAALQTIESLSGRMPHPEHTLTLKVPIRFVLK